MGALLRDQTGELYGRVRGLTRREIRAGIFIIRAPSSDRVGVDTRAFEIRVAVSFLKATNVGSEPGHSSGAESSPRFPDSRILILFTTDHSLMRSLLMRRELMNGSD